MYLLNTYAKLRAFRRRQHGSRGRVSVAAPCLMAVSLCFAAASPIAVARSAAAKHSGDVEVFSAGSLNTLITKQIAPAFHAATGYTLVDTSGGSGSLATEIKGKVAVADVFLSASPVIDATLQGSRGGNWVSWYANFAKSPYVLAFDPKSKFAKELRTMPWYKVITMPGFLLGRTNPAQDPGGVLAVEALDETAKAEHLPVLKKLATETSDEYQEDAEQAGIQNGQLDASFMYEADANSQDSPFVKLTGTSLFGRYTFTIVRGAPHPAAADAFIEFLLGAKAQAALKADHFVVVSPPKVTGHGVPSALSGVLK